MNKLIAYSAHAKRQAKQIVSEKFDDVLCGKFNVPTEDQMEHFLKDVIEYRFDEYKELKRASVKQPTLSKSQLRDEIQKRKMRYESEYQSHLQQASLRAISEIENLLSSLSDAIRTWKIKNLQ